jgi:hypothetical protein
MEYRTATQLKDSAAVIQPKKLSKKERLERWALALEMRKSTHLRTLRSIEHRSKKQQSALRQENSPLTVAFEDPLLRSAGLKNDTFGEAARFFGLTRWQLHDLVCSCNFGQTVAAETIAARVRHFRHWTRVVTLAWLYAIASVVFTGIVWLSKTI